MLVALVGMGTATFAQSFSDDFEGYNLGDYIGANSADWTTWSGTTGGAEDAQTVNNQALSGTQSIYFSTTNDGGGPQDVVLPFGGAHNLGQFTLTQNFRVESGQGAYFNIQGDVAIGVTWALSCQIQQTGDIFFYNGNGTVASGTIAFDTWFEIRVECDLNTNEWEAFVDGNSLGTWANDYNQVASLDLFPVNGSNQGGNSLSSYWVDDVSYNLVPYTLPNENGGITAVNANNGLVSQDRTVSVDVRNLGVSNITSFDLTIDYNGNQVVENVTGVNINSLDWYTVTVATPITLVAGNNPVTATISNVNGNGPDGDPNDDTKVTNLDPIQPANDKVVVGEEATGTWCGWCPRGDVSMNAMAADYDGFWAGIAVHNNDPMADATYDAGMGGLIGGYPSGLVDRGSDIDPTQMEAEFLQRIQVAPAATITPGAMYNSNTNVLYVSLSVDWLTAASGDWRIACVLTEDDVTGTSSGYAQVNYYAGGGNGPMGGYESLPDPVPASQMVYNHVGRLISPSFNGFANSFPASVNMGETYDFNFAFQLDPSWDTNNMHIIGMLIDPTGTIDNAGTDDIAGAETNGFVDGVDVTPMISVTEFDAPDATFTLAPNPASDVAFVNLQLEENQKVSMRVMNITGQVVAQKEYGNLEGAYRLPIPVSEYAAGIYMIELTAGNSVYSEKLIVK